MKVVYTDTYWLEFDSRFAAKRYDSESSCNYVGFGCLKTFCVRPYNQCNNCVFAFSPI